MKQSFVISLFLVLYVKSEFLPYTATIIHNNKQVCSGAVIDKKWVVSAAECFLDNKTKKNMPPKSVTISVGKENWKKGKKHKISKIIKHKDFAKGTARGNIALLQISDKITAVKPIDLHKGQIKNGEIVKSMSWAPAKKSKKMNAKSSTSMRVAHMKTISLKECSAEKLGKAGLCTKPTSKNAQCDVALGAPLVYKGKLVGVTSVPGNCKKKRSVAHTSIAHYHGWIRTNTSPKNTSDKQPSSGKKPSSDKQSSSNKQTSSDKQPSSDKPPPVDKTCQTKHPYTAAIIYKKEYLCAASIIGTSWVLTAAQCVKDRDKNIPAKDLAVSVGNDDWSKGTYHEVFKIYLHKQFDPNQKKNDIAIIDVMKKFVIGPTVNVIELDTKKYNKETAVVSGWGTKKDRKAKQKSARNIQTTSVVLSPLDKCKLKNSDSQLCTIVKQGEKSCPGGIGGPLVLKNKLIGVLSTPGDCKQVNSAYTSISQYHTWIKIQFELVTKGQNDTKTVIINSKVATTKEHQYSAMIWYNGEPLVGGALVSKYVIMTVARIFYNNASGLEMPNTLFEVYLWGGPAGPVYWKSVHPDYEYDKPEHNIAMVYLPILRDHPHPPTKINTYVDVDGHNSKAAYLSLYLNSKRQVESFSMKLLPLVDCKRYHHFVDEESMLCAFLLRNDGTCLDATGHPLMHNNQVVAMLSYGGSCNGQEPSVYLKMSQYEEWIKYAIEDLSM